MASVYVFLKFKNAITLARNNGKSERLWLETMKKVKVDFRPPAPLSVIYFH